MQSLYTQYLLSMEVITVSAVNNGFIGCYGVQDSVIFRIYQASLFHINDFYY